MNYKKKRKREPLVEPNTSKWTRLRDCSITKSSNSQSTSLSRVFSLITSSQSDTVNTYTFGGKCDIKLLNDIK